MTALWQTITSNYIINVAFVSWFLAQAIKTLLDFIKSKKFQPERMVGAGGMPSSHSALVCSLALAVGKVEGYSSTMFAIAICFAGVVMYDAMGVRRAAGEHAKVINKIVLSFKDIVHFFDETKAKTAQTETETEEPEQHKELKEFLGHTPLEVCAGALLGLAVAFFTPV